MSTHLIWQAWASGPALFCSTVLSLCENDWEPVSTGRSLKQRSQSLLLPRRNRKSTVARSTASRPGTYQVGTKVLMKDQEEAERRKTGSKVTWTIYSITHCLSKGLYTLKIVDNPWVVVSIQSQRNPHKPLQYTSSKHYQKSEYICDVYPLSSSNFCR